MEPITRQILDTLASYHNPSHGSNRYNTPWRPDADGGTLAVDTDDKYGLGIKWYDHKDGEAGNGWDLAKLLNIQIGNGRVVKETPYQSLADYAHTHGIPVQAFYDAQWSEVQRNKYLAFRFPTATGYRYRYADPGLSKRKYDSDQGYSNCWYGLERAISMAGDGPIIICNGEASTVAAQYHNVPACCVTGGEKGTMHPALIEQLQSVWTGPILIAYDCDTTGRKASKALARLLCQSGLTAHAIDLRGSDGYDVADFCRLYNGQSAEAIRTLPILFDAMGVVVSSDTTDPLMKSAEPVQYPIPTTAAALARKHIDPTRYFLKDMLRSGLALFIGNPGIGKTPALIQLGLAFAVGGEWLGSLRCPKCRVLYIGVEYDEAYVKETAIASWGSSDLPEDLLFLTVETFTPPKTEEESMALLTHYLTAYQVDVVIIDVFSGFLPREKFKQDKYRGDYAEFLQYQRLFMAHKAILVGSWHGGKHAKDPETAYNGGQGMWGSAGGGRLTMIFDEDGAVRFRSQLRGHDRKEWVLEQARIGNAHFWSVVDSDPDPIFGSDAQRRIYTAVKQNSTQYEPITPQGIRAIINTDAPEMAVKDAYVRQTLGRLEQRGILMRWNGGYIVKRGGSGGSGGSSGSSGSSGSGNDENIQYTEHKQEGPIQVIQPDPTPWIGAAGHQDAISEGPIHPIHDISRSNENTTDQEDYWIGIPITRLIVLKQSLCSDLDSDQKWAARLCEQYGLDFEEAKRHAKAN